MATSPAAIELSVRVDVSADALPVMLVPFLRHWYERVPVPVPTTLKLAPVPAQAPWETGWVVMAVAALTVNAIAELVALVVVKHA